MLTRGEDLLHHPQVITMPLLVQHGTDDKITLCDATEEFFNRLPSESNADRELKLFKGYYHELHNEPEDERIEAIKYIAEWILKRCDNQAAPRAKL
jgi:acylglycerol lipase